MATGTVKWFNADKGFSFVQPRDSSAAGLNSLSDGQAANLKHA